MIGLQAVALTSVQHADPNLHKMAARYIGAIKAEQPDGPYNLGGWSSGGILAFEMARQLVAAGEEVNRLVLVDTPAPAFRGRPSDEVCAGRTPPTAMRTPTYRKYRMGRVSGDVPARCYGIPGAL